MFLFQCDKQHILVCEEFKTEGKCPRGASCPLSHHKGRKRHKRVSFSKDSNRRFSLSTYRKRRRSESLEILGGPVIKKRVEKKKQQVKSSSSHQRYFHVMPAEEKEDKDDKNDPENNELNENTKQELLHEDLSQNTSDSQDNKEDEGPGDRVQKDTNCTTSKSDLEQTRSRVMKKIDLIKKSYVGFCSEDPDDNVENSDTSEANTIKEDIDDTDNHITINEASAQSCNDTDNPDSDANRVQRPPLPKRLPSYIPLDSL